MRSHVGVTALAAGFLLTLALFIMALPHARTIATPSFVDSAELVWIGAMLAAFIALQFVNAPYGRYASDSWGPSIPESAGWIVMESPALFLIALVRVVQLARGQPVPPTADVLLLLWLVHYGNRTVVYPLRMEASAVGSGHARRMPLVTAALGFAFGVANAGVNGMQLFVLLDKPLRALTEPQFVAGVGVWLCGIALNVWADGVLRRLRAARAGYSIPHGGMFEYVSCVNYLGEIVEWCGFALAASTTGAAAFALTTMCNLVPRALAHHAWYRKQFGDAYPKARRAIIPFVL